MVAEATGALTAKTGRMSTMTVQNMERKVREGDAAEGASPTAVRRPHAFLALSRAFRSRSFRAVTIMSLFVTLLCYAPELFALFHFPAGQAIDPIYYAAAYRLLFPMTAAIAGWRFGVKGGLLVCIGVGPVILSHVAAGFTAGPASIDLAVICVGFVFGCVVGRQGEVKRMLEDQAKELRKRSEALAQETAERRHMEAQLAMTDRLASISELVSGVAHEINNPLTGIIGLSQSVLERDLPQDVKEDLGVVVSEAQRAAGFVRDLLTFARRQPPLRQSSQVNSIIDDTLRLRAYEHKLHQVEVVRNFDPRLPEIMVDYHQMQQVFFNIVINAEYFMVRNHKRGRLTITTERVDGRVRASFSDNGPGITEADLDHVFEPFFTTKSNDEGAGLGLSICQSIVARQGGRIYAESPPDGGATFVIELPVTPA